MKDLVHPGRPWNVRSSQMAKKTFNPIRNILENMAIKPNPAKKMISLSIGDPTVFGNLRAHPRILQAVEDSVRCEKNHGYGPSAGFPEARQAVAEHVSQTPGAEVSADAVILCSGCSCALDLCISVLANPGQNLLVPRPGFPLYATLANGLGIETREYDLLPERGWAVDLEHLESLVDSATAGIVVNNPSNPCGSVFSAEHLREILAVAERHRLPVIADEIYEFFTFPDAAGPGYVPMASLTTSVPILSCGGLTKRYLVPGWRLGWITVHDRDAIFEAEVTPGLQRLSQRIIGANTVVQGALPAILKEVPDEFFEDTIAAIQRNAELAHDRLSKIPGVKPVKPAGAMYMMVHFDMHVFPEFATDLQLVEALVQEQSVFPLPGKCFNIADFVRIVLTVPEELMAEACDRIAEFCAEHSARRPANHKLVTGGVIKMQESLDLDSDEASSASSSDEAGDGGGSSSRVDADIDNLSAQKKKFATGLVQTSDFRRKVSQQQTRLA